MSSIPSISRFAAGLLVAVAAAIPGGRDAVAQAPVIIVPPAVPPVTGEPVPVTPSGLVAQLDPPGQQTVDSQPTTTQIIPLQAAPPPPLVQPRPQQPPEPVQPQLGPQIRPQT